METPGYAKFVDSRDDIAEDCTTSTSHFPRMSSTRSNLLFQRRILIEGLHDATHASTPPHARSKSDTSTIFPSSPSQDHLVRPPPLNTSSSRLSIPTASSSSANLFPSKHNLSTTSSRTNNKQNTGLSFVSPWNGVCKFSSTMSNSLKVRSYCYPNKLTLIVQTRTWPITVEL
jgi:hypothetical protein